MFLGLSTFTKQHTLLFIQIASFIQVRERLMSMGSLQPMNIFLRQEIDRMQRVIVLVRNTLSDLKLAIDGTIIMSENLRDALDCMYDARIPALWKKVRGRCLPLRCEMCRTYNVHTKNMNASHVTAYTLKLQITFFYKQVL